MTLLNDIRCGKTFLRMGVVIPGDPDYKSVEPAGEGGTKVVIICNEKFAWSALIGADGQTLCGEQLIRCIHAATNGS